MTSDRHIDDLLSTLRAEMNALDIGDEDARQRLAALILDIETHVKDPKGATPRAGVTGQLEASILKFEASHPRIAGVMNDVLEKLSAMGI